MPKPFALPAVLALAFLPFAAIAQKAPPDPAIVKLQHDVPYWMSQADIPGVSIALIRDGRTEWLGTFGLAETSAKRSVETDSAFNVGSLSKPVFAYGVLKLVDEGKLDLDTPLSHYWPERITDDPRLDKITARIILSHRTGFPNWRSDGDKLHIFFNPGERFSYSGEGIVYLQKTVEHIEGKPFSEIMQRLVFGPVGMTESSYTWLPQWTAHATTGYRPDGSGIPLFHNDTGNAAGSLNTTPRDYARFVQAILAGQGLKPETLRAMETPQIAVSASCFVCTDKPPAKLSTDLFWGLGWGIEQVAGRKFLWHWGDNGVYKAAVVLDLAKKSAIIMMANSQNGLAIGRDVVVDAMGGEHPAFALLNYDAWNSPNLRFTHELMTKGIAPAMQDFAAQLARGDISESTVNAAGYMFLGEKKYTEAIDVLQRNVALHPASSNTYDSLGEAYMNSGDKALAIKNYEKALELDPTASNAKAMLAKLRAPVAP